VALRYLARTVPVLRQLTTSSVQLASAVDGSLKPYWQGELVVDDVIDEAVSVRTFRLKSPDGRPLPAFAAGQYFDVSAKIGAETIRRSYSISSSDQNSDATDLTIKREPHGTMSGHLFDNVVSGSSLAVRGPFGNYTLQAARHERLVLIGAGVGVTPLMSILRSLRDVNSSRQVKALFGFRDNDHALFTNELVAMAGQMQAFEFLTAWSRPIGDERGHLGRISPELVKRWVGQTKRTSFFICGPDEVMAAMQTGLGQLGVRAEDIHVEAFSAGAVDLSLGGRHQIRFGGTGPAVSSAPGENLLDVALRAGVDLDYSCRTGSCGLCRATLRQGDVDHHNDDGLGDGDLERGEILTCQSYPLSDCHVALDD